MRSKDHHLQWRGSTWSIRYDIPADVAEFYSSNSSGRQLTRREALKTSDKGEARKRRDRRLLELDREFDQFRQQKKRMNGSSSSSGDVTSWEGWALEVRRDGGSFDEDGSPSAALENLEASIDAAVDSRVDAILRERRIPTSDLEAYARVVREMKASPLGRQLSGASAIARGKATPIGAAAAQWLTTKQGDKQGGTTSQAVNASGMATYKKALGLLGDRFQTVEEIDHSSAQMFIHGLLLDRARGTVKQYIVAYRGLWKFLGRHRDLTMWSMEGMTAGVPTIPREMWTDEEYIRLLEGAEARGYRDMWLAVRIAAHTGASLAGVVRLEVREGRTGVAGSAGAEGRSLFLHETKQAHRPRIIPCHSAIYEDVVEWCAFLRQRTRRRHTEASLSRKFGNLKTALGFGGTKVLHSFRHSVANKLENARVMDREVARLLGHKIGKISFDTYNAAGLGYETLSKVVANLTWPSVE